MVILENIDIDINKAILQNIDIDKISNRFKFGIWNRATLGKVLIFRDRQLLLYIDPGHYHNLIWFYNVFHQLTAKLRIGPHGPSAAQPAEVEPRREEEELFKRLRKEEPSVQLWRKRSLATLTDAQVISYSCEQIF